MLRKDFTIALHHPTSWIFLFVLVAGLVMAYARAEPPLSNVELFELLLLSLVYLFVGTVVFIYVLSSGSPGYKILYLAFQISLGMVILYLGRGNGWLIMLPLASHSVALFAPREAILPCVLITLGIAWDTSQMLSNWIPFLQSALVFGSAVIFAAVFTNISIRDTRRKEEIERLAAQLEEANHALKEYSEKAQELAVAQERNRLAREIHDGLGHFLTAMNVQLNIAITLFERDPQGAQQVITRVQAILQNAMADVRRSVAALRSEPLLGKDLIEAINELVDESRAHGLVTEFIVHGEVKNIPPVCELTLYRTVQEGLTNVKKHAQAQQVIVQLEFQPEKITLSIQDDGIGSTLNLEEVDKLKNSFGLFGLRERIQFLGGKMSLQTAPQQGFRLEILIPMEQTNQEMR
jgi:signal transduction histidine kinase